MGSRASEAQNQPVSRQDAIMDVLSKVRECSVEALPKSFKVRPIEWQHERDVRDKMGRENLVRDAYIRSIEHLIEALNKNL